MKNKQQFKLSVGILVIAFVGATTVVIGNNIAGNNVMIHQVNFGGPTQEIVKKCIAKTLEFMRLMPENKGTKKILEDIHKLRRSNLIPEHSGAFRRQILVDLERKVRELAPFIGEENWMKMNLESTRIRMVWINNPIN